MFDSPTPYITGIVCVVLTLQIGGCAVKEMENTHQLDMAVVGSKSFDFYLIKRIDLRCGKTVSEDCTALREIYARRHAHD